MTRSASWAQVALLPTPAAQEDEVASAAGPRLVVLSGPERSTFVELGETVVRVGRDAACELTLTDPEVSREHLELRLTHDGIYLRDLGSANGSYCEGARFSEMRALPGTRLRVGATELQLLWVAREHPVVLSEASSFGFGGLRGSSLPMREVYAILERFAAARAPVLIEGEAGSGKKLCAAALHDASARGPLVTFDCAGVAPVEAGGALFGARGARARAAGGTLFIDAIGELPLELQGQLGQALDGDLRLVVASDGGLASAAATRRFDRELYRRLSGLTVTLPPLRMRREDIPELVRLFVGDGDLDLSPEAMAVLLEHDWPGNVAELRHIVERARIHVGPGGLVRAGDLGLDGWAGWPADDSFRSSRQRLSATWQRHRLGQLLRRSGGCVTRAARLAGIDPAACQERVRELGLERSALA